MPHGNTINISEGIFMNIYSILGLIIAVTVFLLGLRLSSDDLKLFIDYPSMFIVVGGTLASSAVSFQLNRIGTLFRSFFQRVILGKKTDHAQIIEDIIKICDESRKGKNISELANLTSDYFLLEGLEMIQDGIIPKNEILNILQERAENLDEKYMREARKIKTIAKFAPAFGMIGTTIGMIVLLANLGGADAMKIIGPAMGICLITTLYGATIANLFVTPIAENLLDSSTEIKLKNQIIIAGLGYYLEKSNPVLVAEKLNSYLSPSDRLDWKKVIQVA